MTIPDEAVFAAAKAITGPLRDPTEWELTQFKVSLTAALPFLTGVKVKALDDDTMQKLRSALRFSASRSVMSSADEDRILSAIEGVYTTHTLSAPSPCAQALEEAAKLLEREADELDGLVDSVSHHLRSKAKTIRALSSQPVADGCSDLNRFWRPISEADKSITFNQDFDLGNGEKMTIRNSDDYWVRDDDGRVYRATWCDHKGGYWWDIEGESPVDPVEYMPHPLSLPASPGARVKELEHVNAKLCDDVIDYELKVAERDVSLKALETQLAAAKEREEHLVSLLNAFTSHEDREDPELRAALEAKP